MSKQELVPASIAIKIDIKLLNVGGSNGYIVLSDRRIIGVSMVGCCVSGKVIEVVDVVF